MKKRLVLSIFLSACFAFSGLYAQNTQISDGLLFDGEPYMIAAPNNSQHLVVVWMGYEIGNAIALNHRVSFDGGDTWSTGSFLPHTATGRTTADPSMAFDSEGHLFLCLIDYLTDGSEGAVYVYRSDDGGISWNTPTEVINVNDDPGEFPLDRPWMAIDRSGGVYDGYIYINTKPAPWEPAPNASYFIRSIDNGLSFEDWVFTDAPGWSVGNLLASPMAFPVVTSEGHLLISYPGWEISENLLPRMMLARSEDGGATFSYSEIAETADGVEDTLPKLGYSLYSDPSNPNKLAFLFLADWEGDVDIFQYRSENGGATWDGPDRINNDPVGNGIMQDLAWGAFNQYGQFLVTWRDRRISGLPDYGQSTEVYGRIQNIEGVWGEEFVLSSESAAHAEVLNGNGNDFMCNAFTGDTVYAVWGDTRDGILRIWFSKYTSDGGVSVTDLAATQGIYCSPNPASELLNIQSDKRIRMLILNESGQIVRQLDKGNTWVLDLSGWQTGLYFLQGEDGSRVSFIRQ